MLWVDWNRALQKRNGCVSFFLLFNFFFWHGLCAKLCLPSQYAEEFAELDPSHAICPSSDSPAKKSFFSAPRPRCQTSLIYLFSYCTFAFVIKARIARLLMSQCCASKQKCCVFGSDGRRENQQILWTADHSPVWPWVSVALCCTG